MKHIRKSCQCGYKLQLLFRSSNAPRPQPGRDAAGTPGASAPPPGGPGRGCLGEKFVRDGPKDDPADLVHRTLLMTDREHIFLTARRGATRCGHGQGQGN